MLLCIYGWLQKKLRCYELLCDDLCVYELGVVGSTELSYGFFGRRGRDHVADLIYMEPSIFFDPVGVISYIA